jgi:hypothetical protein
MKLRCFVLIAVLALAVAAFAQTNNPPTAEVAPTPMFLVNGQPAALYLTVQSENGSEGPALRLVSLKSIEGSCNLTTAPAADGVEKLADIANGRTLTAVAAAAPALSVISVITNYSGTAEMFCPASNPVLLIASCDLSGLPILWDQKSTLPPGSTSSTHWTHWLLPSAAAATGVHCQQPSTAFSAQVRLRCASIK